MLASGVFLGVFSACLAAAPTFDFESNTLAVYSPSPGMGTGVAVADFDADGDPDIFVPTGAGTPNLLLRNRGDGTFEEVAAQFGLADLRQARVALWADYDGDGDLDLFVGRDCFFASAGVAAAGSCGEVSLSLFEHQPTGFVDVSASVGLAASAGSLSTFHAGGLSAGDVSGDGLPDIYFARWLAGPELYISDTLFVASEAPGYSLGSGLAGIGGEPGGEWQTLFHDFDGDGRLDMFVNVDFGPNQLWMNGGDLNFTNVAVSAGVDSEWNEMGLAVGDYDNDGDLDLYITNIYDWQADVRGEISHNRLYRNDSVPGSLQFAGSAIALGVENSEWGWGTTWLD
ncbi:MAG TPA: VCBS repeat-containing protein, partial [Wenzhouxiangellaceae bacterium]|nr:VCBS repeat-containing protein [Wenzhouxiangellaceae bacterium]